MAARASGAVYRVAARRYLGRKPRGEPRFEDRPFRPGCRRSGQGGPIGGLLSRRGHSAVERGEIGARKPAAIGPAGSGSVTRDAARVWLPVLLGLAIDLTTTLTLVALGWTLGTSNLVGFLAGIGVYLAARKLGREARSEVTLDGGDRAGWAAWWLVAATLALGLRGGAVATALAYGLPVWIGVSAGLLVAWGTGGTAQAVRRRLAELRAESPTKRWTIAAVGILVSVFALHLLYIKVLPLTPEEAYYWNYSIRPDLGYLDHPPMVAWMIALSGWILGQGEASLRLVSLAAGGLLAYFVYRLARPLVDPASALLAAGLAVLVPYGFFATGTITTPDATLAVAWAALLGFLHRALVEDDRRAWYGVGIALGLGLLSKYTIVTLGAAALAFCLTPGAWPGSCVVPSPTSRSRPPPRPRHLLELRP